MLTLIRGRARKSYYMEALFANSPNSTYVIYGDFGAMALPLSNHRLVIYPEDNLKNDLTKIFQTYIKRSYHTVFIYGNFNTEDELEVVKEVYEELDQQLDIVVSIQDYEVEKDKIVIEEIR